MSPNWASVLPTHLLPPFFRTNTEEPPGVRSERPTPADCSDKNSNSGSLHWPSLRRTRTWSGIRQRREYGQPLDLLAPWASVSPFVGWGCWIRSPVFRHFKNTSNIQTEPLLYPARKLYTGRQRQQTWSWPGWMMGAGLTRPHPLILQHHPRMPRDPSPEPPGFPAHSLKITTLLAQNPLTLCSPHHLPWDQRLNWRDS